MSERPASSVEDEIDALLRLVCDPLPPVPPGTTIRCFDPDTGEHNVLSFRGVATPAPHGKDASRSV